MACGGNGGHSGNGVSAYNIAACNSEIPCSQNNRYNLFPNFLCSGHAIYGTRSVMRVCVCAADACGIFYDICGGVHDDGVCDGGAFFYDSAFYNAEVCTHQSHGGTYNDKEGDMYHALFASEEGT